MKNAVLGGGFVALALILAACSSSTPASDDVSEPAPEQSKAPAKQKADEPKPEASAAPEGEPTPAQKDAAQVCVEGCASENPAGAEEFANLLKPCACEASVCGDVCGDACTATKGDQNLLASASQECRACVAGALKKGGKCSNELQTKCPAEENCLPFALCAMGCTEQ